MSGPPVLFTPTSCLELVWSQVAAGMQAQRDEQRELEQKLLEEQKLRMLRNTGSRWS